MRPQHIPARFLRCFGFCLLLLAEIVLRAQDPLFEFTGKDPVEPTNWQKPLNWSLNGEPAARVPGTGPDDRVLITGFSVTSPSYKIKSLTLTGSITGGFLSVSESLSLAGGAFKACTVTILDHAAFTTTTSGLNGFESCEVHNRGIFSPRAVGLGALPGEPPTVLFNDPLTGRIELQDGTSIGSTVGGSILSSGLVIKLSGPGTASISGVSLTQTAAGSVECQGGTLQLGLASPTQGKFVCDQPILVSAADAIVEISGAASEILSGARVSGPGKVLIRHAMVSGPINIENAEIPLSGVLEGPGTITLLGLMTINGGSLLGAPGETVPGALLIIQNTGTLRFVAQQNGAVLGRNVQSSGLVQQEMGSGPGHPFADSASPTFANLAAGTVILSSSGGLGSCSLYNAGVVRKVLSTDMNSNQSLSRSCENVGLIDVQTGLLRILGFNQSAGELRVAAGAEARFQGPPASISGGVVSGSGTLRGISSSSQIQIAGTIRPGSPAGNLTFIKGEDSIALAPSATVEIEVSGTSPGVDYDQLVLTSGFGNFPLAGSVVVRFVSGFVPSPGQVFSVVRYSPGRLGAFTRISAPDLDRGLLLVPRYSNTGLDLTVTADPQLRISSITETSAVATCRTAVGPTYQIESSTDLAAWASIGNALTGDGLTHELPLVFVSSPHRFFRMRVN